MEKEQFRQVAHLFAGILILIHGFDSFEGRDFQSTAGYFGVALLVLIVSCLHKFIEQKFIQANVAFFLLEGLTLFYSAWDYHEKGRTFFSYFIGASAIFFLIFAFITLLSTDQPKKSLSTHRHRSRKRKKTMSVTGH